MLASGTVPDRYRRLELLGEGSTGQVWLVEDQLRPGARFALKEPLEGPTGDGEMLRREYVLLSRLSHPGLVEVHDLDRSPATGLYRFTEEHVDGVGLAAAVAEEGPALLLQSAAEALQVLDFLHDFGLVHGDLKPANLLVRRRPRLGSRVVVLDLGLAARGDDGGPDAPVPATACGTLAYLAPERFEGAPPTRRSDLYGLGAALHDVVYGTPPYGPTDDVNRFIDAVRLDRRVRRAAPAGSPPGLAEWIEELLASDASRRPASAREALSRLNAACRTAFSLDSAVGRAARLASDPPPARQAELRELWSLVESASAPRLIWLTGPAGSGKSRALRWLKGEALLRDFRVIAPPPSLVFAPGEEPAHLLERLRRDAAATPTLLLLDDVAASDGRLAQLLDRIAREGRGPALRVVAALRPGETRLPMLRRLIEDTGTVPTLHRIELRPLDAAGVRLLVERATGNRAPSEVRLRWLTEACEGNPLLTESMLVADSWADGREPPPSGSLVRSVTARLGLLSPAGCAWLEALAVIGSDAAEAIVAELAELDGASAHEAAEEVRMAGLARVQQARWSPESRWVTEQVLERAAGERHRTLHRRAAELLLARGEGDADPWRLARLWAATGEPARAMGQAVRAAEQAARTGDPAGAAERFAFAIRHADDEAAKGELLLRQAEALELAGLDELAAGIYGEALVLADGRARRADLLGRQAHALVQAGHFPQARALAEQALELASRPDLTRERARALRAMGVVLARLGQERDALPLFEEALALFNRAGDVLSEADTLQALAAAKNRLQREDAEADTLRAVALYRRLGQHGSELKSLIGLAVIHMREDRRESAQSLLDDVRRRAADRGNLDLLETALSKLASLAIEEGRLDQALALSQEALEHARHLGDPNRVMVDRCRLAEALIGCGRPAEAVELLRDALQQPPEQVEPDMVDSARMLLAEALLEAGGDDRDIASLLERARGGFRERRKSRPLLMALAIELERRSRPDARAPFDAALVEYEELLREGAGRVEPEIRLRAELAQAASCLLRGDEDAARAAATAAAELGRESGRLAHAARAQALLGACLERRGEREAAREAFDRGTRLLDRAASRIADPALRASFLDRGLFRSLPRHAARPAENDRRLLTLYDMIRALNSETDPDALLESILDMALRAVAGERGMILLAGATAGEFSVRLARNLEAATEQDVETFSRGIVAQAGAGRAVLALDPGNDDRFRDMQSINLYGIRSLMCVPLRSRGAIIGTVYLDSRRKGGLFSAEDLRFLEAFADHAALALQNARERAELQQENRRLQGVAETRLSFANLIGRSPAMQHVFRLIEKVAESELPVLIQGESGTGKELVARAIHFNGPRRRKIFLCENCSAIPETLLESELFGHVRGAFTGAERDRRGLFEQADTGTLFLDEVGDMSPSMQARLLRALQHGEVRRVGADRPIHVNVRVLAATHRDLAREVEAGRFREDLFYRLQVLLVRLPPLRERPEDVPDLIDHFLERIGRERGRPAPRLDAAVRQLLQRHAWPGNVRQLENSLQRLTLLAGDGPVTLDALRADEGLRSLPLAGVAEAEGAPQFSLEEGVREQLCRALAASGGNRERAARLLGISRATIYRKIRELGIG